jgi:hypothetical protein
MQPGQYAFTVIPCAPHSCAADWVSPRMANFVAEYVLMKGNPFLAATDAAPGNIFESGRVEVQVRRATYQ